MTFLSDTHCHLYMQDFEDDLDKVIENASAAGIRKILVPGIDAGTSQESITLSQTFPEYIYAAVGIQPNSSSGVKRSDLDLIESQATLPNVVAIGEIGLDFYREKASVDDQVFVFKKMLSISKETEKPVCLHNRDADKLILEILDEWYADLVKSSSNLATFPGVFHSFDGSHTVAEWAQTHNFFLGISGPVTFSKALNLQDQIRDIDLSHLLVETDSPYLSPHPFRGKRNEPAYARLIYEKIAELKQIGVDEVVSTTSENANALFGWGAP